MLNNMKHIEKYFIIMLGLGMNMFDLIYLFPEAVQGNYKRDLVLELYIESANEEKLLLIVKL